MMKSRLSTSHLQSTAQIEGRPEAIFSMIAEMRKAGRWLPCSEAFGGTTEVSPFLARLGTIFLDEGPAGQSTVSVTEYDPPKYIAFHHTVLRTLCTRTIEIDVHIRYTIEPAERSTCVIRDMDLTIQIPGLLKVLKPFVTALFRKQNVRMLKSLKRFIEAQPTERGPEEERHS
jgi:hypothetical protein